MSDEELEGLLGLLREALALNSWHEDSTQGSTLPAVEDLLDEVDA
jgi:hypothetical protein